MVRQRPTLVSVLLAVGGASALLLLEERLPPAGLAPALLGGALVLVTMLSLLRELRRRDRLAIAGGAAVLGFFAGVSAGAGAHPWALGYGGAWLPTILLFVGGVGRERLAFELERLETACDVPAKRAGALARAQQIRAETGLRARALDPEGTGAPEHAGDPRAVHAYAAQVVGYALSLEGRFAEAAASLGEVPARWMPGPMRVLMRCNLSFWRLCAGDVTGAQEALDGLGESDAPEAARPALRAARAAVLVRSGEPAAALDIVGKVDGERGEPGWVRQRYRVTRAHALAALGDEEGARAALGQVADEGDAGREELRRWVPAGGPAAGMIAEMAGRENAAARGAGRTGAGEGEGEV
ncbi:Hypothetical protein CAP_1719 [Chondromyces apiculatus DSM 436]|uniref:Uncharacterized protein n=1 Tax=Chondromyces apiculatus DSM 436 TaxID=1192034 RepID=A0A017TBJ7_9BACT|nr:Hypothetical protein CAP_1719 [Chondromyces apiculatus DSM 436]